MSPDHSVLGGALFVAARLHHHFRGPKGDYIGLGLAAAGSWAGLPGPGEAALITGGFLAAHGKLDILSAVAVAWLGAMAGGVLGWFVGLKFGRRVVTARGPLRRARLHALERGERFYDRFGTAAVFFTPSWVAGIHGMRASRFVPANAIAAAIWSAGIGFGAYFAGPPIIDLVEDLGVVSAILVGLLVASAIAGLLLRRRRQRV
jgi:membrane-associated protein